MRNFTISVMRRKNISEDTIDMPQYERIITYFDNDIQNNLYQPYGTFNEKLIEKENDQFELSFSMSHYVLDHHLQINTNKEALSHNTINKNYNYWLDIIKLGTRLILTIDSGIKKVYMIITNIVPVISSNNIIYNFTAQDEVSFSWAKKKIGYSYSNLTTDYGQTFVGVQNIYQIATQVLTDLGNFGFWTVENTQGEVEYVEHALVNKKVSLEVLDSNPYNVIIEACNTVGCFMKVNYESHQITFYQKDAVKFSGYRYRPECNLQEFSASYNINEYTSIMHVLGGTNEYGEIVSLIPYMPYELLDFVLQNDLINTYEDQNIWEHITLDGIEEEKNENVVFGTTDNKKTSYNDVLLWETETINDELVIKNIKTTEVGQSIIDFLTCARKVPHLGQFLYDFSYFYNSGLLTEDEFNKLKNEINVNMRNNNIYLKYYLPIQQRLAFEIQKTFNEMVNIAKDSYGFELKLEYDENEGSWKIASEDQTNTVKDCMDSIDALLSLDLLQSLITLHGKPEGESVSSEKMLSYYPEIKDIHESYKRYINSNEELLTKWEKYKEIPDETSDDESIVLNAEKANIKDKLELYCRMIYSGSYKGAYSMLIDKINSWLEKIDDNTKNNDKSWDYMVSFYTKRNDEIWKYLYSSYGDYIYEARYENTDELNSEGLYNQSVYYFEKQRKPVASYSISTIDIGALELIGLPRLSIGSKIKVYQNELNLKDEALDNISFNNNDLIITQLTTDLRNPIKVSIEVEQVQPYSNIVSKLLQSIRY